MSSRPICGRCTRIARQTTTATPAAFSTRPTRPRGGKAIARRGRRPGHPDPDPLWRRQNPRPHRHVSHGGRLDPSRRPSPFTHPSGGGELTSAHPQLPGSSATSRATKPPTSLRSPLVLSLRSVSYPSLYSVSTATVPGPKGPAARVAASLFSSAPTSTAWAASPEPPAPAAPTLLVSVYASAVLGARRRRPAGSITNHTEEKKEKLRALRAKRRW